MSLRRIPDFEKVSKELARNGVTLKLLWMEYCEECWQLNQQPFMYSPFCFHFQKFAEQERTTMHIPESPETESKWTEPVISCTSLTGILAFHAYSDVAQTPD